jgi:hypothetical protein
MQILGPKEKDALPFVMIVFLAFLVGLAFLVVSITLGP